MAPIVSSGDLVTAINTLLPMAIPPEQLARLHQGQILDKDPITKYEMAVSLVGRDEAGNDVVRLTSCAGPGSIGCDCSYDRKAGILIGTLVIDSFSQTRSQMVLTGKE